MLRNKKGLSMLIVISVIFTLLILGAAAALISTGHFGITYTQRRRLQAAYAAEAAMQHVLWGLRTNQPTPGQLPVAFDVNGFRPADINIVVGPVNPSGVNPEGVRPINITVTY